MWHGSDAENDKDLQIALRRWAWEIVLDLPRERDQALIVLDEAARVVQQYFYDEPRPSARVCTRAATCVACKSPGVMAAAPAHCFATLARSLEARDAPPDNLVPLKKPT